MAVPADDLRQCLGWFPLEPHRHLPAENQPWTFDLED